MNINVPSAYSSNRDPAPPSARSCTLVKCPGPSVSGASSGGSDGRQEEDAPEKTVSCGAAGAESALSAAPEEDAMFCSAAELPAPPVQPAKSASARYAASSAGARRALRFPFSCIISSGLLFRACPSRAFSVRSIPEPGPLPSVQRGVLRRDPRAHFFAQLRQRSGEQTGCPARPPPRDPDTSCRRPRPPEPGTAARRHFLSCRNAVKNCSATVWARQ